MIEPKTAAVQDLNDRLDKVEEFYLPDIIEHHGEPLATVTPAADHDPHLGAATVRPYRRIELVHSSEKIIIGMLMDGVIVLQFVITCYLLYKSIVWSIWG